VYKHVSFEEGFFGGDLVRTAGYRAIDEVDWLPVRTDVREMRRTKNRRRLTAEAKILGHSK
jgi:hypothetical protein